MIADDDDFQESDDPLEWSILRYENFSDMYPVPVPVPYPDCSQQSYMVSMLKEEDQ